MTQRLAVFLTFILMLVSPALSPPAKAGQTRPLYPVIRVVDGDTIYVRIKGRLEKIRLLNVDTPESVHPDRSRNSLLGKKASAYTRSRLAGKRVGLEFDGRKRGKYGRLLAYIMLDNQNFNLELVKKGWSPYYTKYGTSRRFHREFASAQAEAKSLGLNIWHGAPQGSGPANAAINLSGNYHGNVKSRIFHAPGCRHFNCKHCTRAFSSPEAAIGAGFSPCAICTP